MEAIQVSDSPEHPYRKQLAQKAAEAYMTLVPPWGGDELFHPNFAFRRKVLEVLDAEKGTFSSREQLKSFVWEAFTVYKMMPILDGRHEPLDIDFPIVGDQAGHWGAVWKRGVHSNPSDSDIVAKVEFLEKKIHLLLNRRFVLLESLWKDKFTEAAIKRSQELGELMKNLQQQRDVLWSFCTVSGYAYPDEIDESEPQSSLARELNPSAAESFFLRYMPKQFTETEHALFVFQTTGLDAPEERAALYEKILERKLLLWYWISKNEVLESDYSDECASQFCSLLNEIQGCFLKIKVIPNIGRDPMLEPQHFTPLFQYTLSHLINMVFSLDSKQESLGFMELMAEIIGILHAHLEKTIVIRRETIDDTVRESKMVEVQLTTRRALNAKMDQLRKLHTTWEEQHDMYAHAKKALNLLARIRFS